MIREARCVDGAMERVRRDVWILTVLCLSRVMRDSLNVRVGWRTANAIAAFDHSRERAPSVDSGNQASQLRRDG